MQNARRQILRAHNRRDSRKARGIPGAKNERSGPVRRNANQKFAVRDLRPRVRAVGQLVPIRVKTPRKNRPLSALAVGGVHGRVERLKRPFVRKRANAFRRTARGNLRDPVQAGRGDSHFYVRVAVVAN